MNSMIIELLILAGIALFLVLRLRSILGTRDGFEKPPAPAPGSANRSEAPRSFDVIDGGPDRDITDHVPEGSESALALAAMKRVESDFSVTDFLMGARGAYEMILMAYERGDIAEVRDFLSNDVYDTLSDVIAQREEQGLTIEAEFIGVRETSLAEASYDATTGLGEVTVRYVGELTSLVKNAEGEIIEGSSKDVKRQKDVWTFARTMGSSDPNWQLVATDE
ncbi:MAG: Tim44/TimA family putative adaptor protein [Pelagimonas sp.]|nr:Tim44/TimA family putative adaptor protein [Pelagimonas sp.]